LDIGKGVSERGEAHEGGLGGKKNLKKMGGGVKKIK